MNDDFDNIYFKEKGSHQRPFNLRRMEEYNRPKIFLRQSDVKLTSTYIEELVFCNYSLFNLYHPENDKSLLKYLLGLLNSNLLTYYAIQKEIILLKAGKTPQIRSGQRGPIGIRQLTIEILSQEILTSFVDYILFLKLHFNEGLSSFFKRLIDAMVYELYLPDEIKAAGCEVLKHLTSLPELKDGWSDEEKLQTIEKVYKELSDPRHPVSIAMEKMKTVPEVRIIEGLDKNE